MRPSGAQSKAAWRALRGAAAPSERAGSALRRLRELVASAEAGEGATVRESLRVVDVETFIDEAKAPRGVLLDARAPCEFLKGHMLGANNLALLDDEDRVKVGTRFKQTGRGPAIELGFSLLEPKVTSILQRADDILNAGDADRISIYCARGGLRSQLTGWFLQEALGNAIEKVTVCNGGYKAYRNLMLDCYLSEPQPEIRIVGGRTGVGKTRLLHSLCEAHGEQTIDLEGLAEHKGSAFGRIGQNVLQPSSEQFHNLVGTQWRNLDPSRPVYIEDEGPNVGDCQVPQALYARMRSAPLVMRVEVPEAQRVKNLIRDYCVVDEKADPENFARWNQSMCDAATRVRRRLGDDRLKAVLEGLQGRQYEDVAKTLLSYYDRLYDKHLTKNRDTRDFVSISIPENELKGKVHSEAELYAALASQAIEAANRTRQRSTDSGCAKSSL
ncbi:Hypothetical Protein FCC1311_084272 [Hondaea fermentalgiana]|uniref:Rhodanese domain-containing protein n=1 Tax=Hondaea fermentalgiana TaxID=2315210 RepID=A0A2R5GMS8_9STRA|nr:Hypothetical Protein FCC1311_084272 [Hondaea fermentalgiana]|eukprot:GBG32202.1 Hypothetical Protein FCC1311_084272 [Hondaea fermentalgiana]